MRGESGLKVFGGEGGVKPLIALGANPLFIYYKNFPLAPYIFNQLLHIVIKILIFRVYNDLGGRFPSDHVLSTLKIPVLIINGGNDRFCQDPKYFLEKIPQSKYH